MKNGVELSVIYTDEPLLELRVRASNGVFAGEVDVYSSSEALAKFANVLRDFPATRNDVREFELGVFDAKYAGGGARFRFYCSDSAGHAAVEVKLRADPHPEGSVNSTATFHIPIEAVAIDSFVKQLERMESVLGRAAFLEAGGKGY